MLKKAENKRFRGNPWEKQKNKRGGCEKTADHLRAEFLPFERTKGCRRPFFMISELVSIFVLQLIFSRRKG